MEAAEEVVVRAGPAAAIFLVTSAIHFHFRRNQAFLGGWGWDLGLGGYGDFGYGNTTVVAFPQATPQAANVTGSIATGPCHWNADTFNVPSAAGGTRPVQVVGCR